MKHACMITSICCTLSFFGCNGKELPEAFDYSSPEDLSSILQEYDRKKNDTDFILQTMFPSDIMEGKYYIFDDTSFVLRVPEYNKSRQPFLANAEDFYNSCAVAWNIWSNYEAWYRGCFTDIVTGNTTREVWKDTKKIDVSIIKDTDVRKAALFYKNSLLLKMNTDPSTLEEEDVSAMDCVADFCTAIESKAYKFYEDEEIFVHSLDSITRLAEGMSEKKFQRYLEAPADEQLKVILGELAACQNFDEQCSLWRNWANCRKSILEDEWIVAVGNRLIQSSKYSPILYHVWLTWRALCQGTYFGHSKDSDIPNPYYNEFRKMCYITCLKRIEREPNDIYAMNCAAVIGGRSNMNRLGQNYFGNEAMIEEAEMLPKRFPQEELDEE